MQICLLDWTSRISAEGSESCYSDQLKIRLGKVTHRKKAAQLIKERLATAGIPCMALRRHHAAARGCRLSDLKSKLRPQVLLYEFTA